MFNNKTILITGGTGSFGKSFTQYFLKKYSKIRKLIIYSRDEFKQSSFEEIIEKKYKKKIRFLLGDVRDEQRLNFAMKDVDFVIHAAALKQVPKAEYDPIEFIKTNIIGAQNVIETSLKNNVKKVIALSTDKASSPLNLYGATKLCSDRLFISANNIKGRQKISFSVVRYGNVLGSRGSVFPLFYKKIKDENLPITDKNMTRFNITLNESIKLVEWGLKNSIGSEIIVPKLKSFKIIDFAKAINPKAKINIIGIRPGEKIHEEMISLYDSTNTIELKDKFIICPNDSDKKWMNYYKIKFNAKKSKKEFIYSSQQKKYLSINNLKKLISENKIYLEL